MSDDRYVSIKVQSYKLYNENENMYCDASTDEKIILNFVLGCRVIACLHEIQTRNNFISS